MRMCMRMCCAPPKFFNTCPPYLDSILPRNRFVIAFAAQHPNMEPLFFLSVSHACAVAPTGMLARPKPHTAPTEMQSSGRAAPPRVPSPRPPPPLLAATCTPHFAPCCVADTQEFAPSLPARGERANRRRPLTSASTPKPAAAFPSPATGLLDTGLGAHTAPPPYIECWLVFHVGIGRRCEPRQQIRACSRSRCCSSACVRPIPAYAAQRTRFVRVADGALPKKAVLRRGEGYAAGISVTHAHAATHCAQTSHP